MASIGVSKLNAETKALIAKLPRNTPGHMRLPSNSNTASAMPVEGPKTLAWLSVTFSSWPRMPKPK